MNLIGLLLGVLTAITLLGTGCEPASPADAARLRKKMGDVSSLPKVEVTEASLGGKWTASCAQDPDKTEFFRKDTIEITSNYMDYGIEYFSDSECQSRSFHQSTTGFFGLQGEAITIRFANVSILPEALIIAAAFNQFDGFCAEKTWEVGKIKTFGNLAICGLVVEHASTVKRFGESELFFGEKKFTR